jgi:hypothetical protein
VLVFDSNTTDHTVIPEMLRVISEKVGADAAGIPFDVVCFIPQIEAIFFRGDIELDRIFPRMKTVFDQVSSNTDPKQQLDVLLGQGGGPETLASFLGKLTSDEAVQIQSKEPIRRISGFLSDNLAPVHSG